jgi:hypothetical protein
MTLLLEQPTQPRQVAQRSSPLGWLPLTLLAIAAGLLTVSVADALSRTGRSGGSLLFWLAVVLIVLPAGLRLCSDRVGIGERIATVVAVGMGLYAVKVLRDPFAFTYGDEFSHLANLQSILGTGNLFGSNSVLPITPRYPGLEIVAALISRAAGMSAYAAGVTTIAAGRLLMMLGLYTLYDRLTGSPRTAALGALVYAAAPNFLFWSAQFAYESLALPLATVALFLAIRWAQENTPQMRRSWEAAFAITVAAVVVTHHVTSYVLAIFLLALCLIHWRLHGRRGAPWPLAAGTVLLAIIWLGFVASGTVGYLSPVLTDAVNQVIHTLTRETGTRALFANQGGAEVTPVPEIVVALLGVVLLAIGVLAGIVRVRKQRWRNPVLVLLVICAVAYLLTLPLRFVPDAWETASRVGDFLFIGVGLTVGLGVVWLVEQVRVREQLRRPLIAVAVTIMFASGVIAGWPANQRLAAPRRVVVDGRVLDPPSVVAADWSARTLGSAQSVFAQDADALFFLDNGHQTAYEGDFAPDVQYLLNASTLQPWMSDTLRRYRVTLVVTDRRVISADNLFGFFFDTGAPALSPAAGANKFDTAAANRLYDSGDLVIYGVRGLW